MYQIVFDLLDDIENVKMTQTRADNLSEKRRDKGLPPRPPSDFVGPDAPPFTEEERRIASISNPEVNSGNKETLYASLEQETQQLGNLFCHQTIRSLFSSEGVEIDWVVGRFKKPVLKWRQRYTFSSFYKGLVTDNAAHSQLE